MDMVFAGIEEAHSNVCNSVHQRIESAWKWGIGGVDMILARVG
jgi:hypothetical protein